MCRVRKHCSKHIMSSQTVTTRHSVWRCPASADARILLFFKTVIFDTTRHRVAADMAKKKAPPPPVPKTRAELAQEAMAHHHAVARRAAAAVDSDEEDEHCCIICCEKFGELPVSSCACGKWPAGTMESVLFDSHA